MKRALLEIRTLRAQLTELQTARREPIAIVGMGCRLPGGIADTEAFWEALRGGRDLIGPIPSDRWNIDDYYDADPDRPGTMCTREGGFLDQIDEFDAGLFGLAPREAAAMDPQQRLALEVAWTALEDASIAPNRLAGHPTGVFMGVVNSDYGRLLLRDRTRVSAYAASGGSPSLVAGRLSYLLGLTGPSLVVDTACSSSLVAVHLAMQSLRARECDLALAGGVNVIVGPEVHIALTKAHMMAPDGRCKTFDARADGYTRGEGCAIVVLRRLSDAIASGDRILALVRGSAVNQDGRSGGMTAPNAAAQQAVIRSALASADLQPDDVTYVEAHGTGTALGDPLELQALAAVFGANRPSDRPLWVGSCKTNVGHLEAAAGIAGLLKTVLALRHQEIPPHLHLTTPTPHVDWSALPCDVPTSLRPWPSSGDRRRAGVSSFGISGTNAHVVLEEAPPPQVGSNEPSVPSASAPRRELLLLSAASTSSLRMLASRYARRLDRCVEPLSELCVAASEGRARLHRRLAVSGEDASGISAELDRYARGLDAPSVTESADSSAGGRPSLGFVFTGQGSQYVGMGRGLARTSPVFRAALEECSAIADPELPCPLVSLLFEPQSGISLDDTGLAQPALFALEYALSAMWRHWGVEPAVVLGHSVGEIVAATVAGAVTVPDALRLTLARARAMQAMPRGAMTVVFAESARVHEVLRRAGVDVDVAAVNGPANVVLSGACAELAAADAALAAEGIQFRRLAVSHAFHSRMMDPALDAFHEAIAGIGFAPSRLPLVSNVTGEVFSRTELPDAAYWRAHVRHPVQFERGLRTAASLGVTHLIEIGPRPALLSLASEVASDRSLRLLPSLRPGEDDWSVALGSLARLFVDGVDVRWTDAAAGGHRRRVTLPLYPFQRRVYWVDVGPPVASDPRPSEAPSRASTPDIDAGGPTGPDPRSTSDTIARGTSTATAGHPLAAELRALSPTAHAARREVVLRLVRAHAAHVLELEEELLDDVLPLTMLGLDSLMAVQLRNALYADCGVELPIPQLMFRAGISHFADLVVEKLRLSTPSMVADRRPTPDWEEGSL